MTSPATPPAGHKPGQPTLPVIIVDDREQPSGLPEAIRKVVGQAPEVRRLMVGDIAIGDQILIERKTVADFIDSILDGRLERQLNALMQSAKQAILIIEGGFDQEIMKGMSPRAIRHTFLTIELDRRIPVLRSSNVNDTALWIAALIDRKHKPTVIPFRPEAKPIAPHPAHHRAPHRPHPAAPSPASLATLRRVPGLGNLKTLALLEHFGSLAKVISAKEEEIAVVAGIGATLARAIKEAFDTHGVR